MVNVVSHASQATVRKGSVRRAFVATSFKHRLHRVRTSDHRGSGTPGIHRRFLLHPDRRFPPTHVVEAIQVKDQACAVENKCYVCGGELKERRLKKHCTVCGTLCETCCDNGME